MDNMLTPELTRGLLDRGVDMGTNVIFAALIFIIGLFVAGVIRRALKKMIAKNKRIDVTLANFFSSMVYYVIMVMVFIAVLERFGVQTTSLVAALGAATLAIGLALQGTLSNVAAGVMLVLFRPYSLGDFVEIAGQAGSVKDVNLFTTVLATGDNKRIIVPNGSAWGDVITNYSANGTRRVDFVFSIDYSDDINGAMALIQETLRQDTRIHKTPDVFTAVTAHGGSSVDIVTRVWCDGANYWGIYFDGMKNIKEAFDANGFSIPYPHQVNVQRDA
ncbi:MAG: mechanosensitive ion channel protein MscS [Robiginitomaculum sp.]|nr:MAG: mechanosensitive ion channel protein MscS [Robiginitomaculum sp.]